MKDDSGEVSSKSIVELRIFGKLIENLKIGKKKRI